MNTVLLHLGQTAFTPLHILAVLAAYVIGSISFGYIVAKKVGGIDIREHGSGNPGATNVKRVLGNKAGLTVLVLDFLKGLLPVLAAVYWLFPGDAELHLLIAVALIVGHSRSIFLKFTGGKSAITGLGTLFGLAPLAALILAVVVFVIFKLTRIVSVATLTAAVLTPILLLVLHAPFVYTVYGLLTGLYVIYLHRSNIARLVQGTENKL